MRQAPAGTEAESETLAPGTGGNGSGKRDPGARHWQEWGLESEALAPGTGGIGGRWLLGPGGWCIIKGDV